MATASLEIGDADAKVSGDELLDRLDRHGGRAGLHAVTERFSDEGLVEGDAAKLGEGGDPKQRTFEVADVGVDELGDRARRGAVELDAVALGFLFDDGDPRLE